ncbi:hypothetical protein QQS21_002472 [Conoideocrella luteorostrata]|uniref:F-box domain-containing protein n=1 Tax=Conoideocrella luteorostrata TaxID=1105319 RepID=A0AAJ0CV38_9HYPO|nr:hypothetical protein QQS21_002472 [Conoideocrella luteorostrata]
MSTLQLDALPADEIDRIVDKLSYHETDFDEAVAHQQLSTKTPPPPLLHGTSKPSTCGIGTLARLPPEVISYVCLMLDVQSLLTLSQVNRHARNVVATNPQLRRLADHASNCLWVTMKTGLARHITTRSLYHALMTRKCSFCRYFGSFIILPTAQRCCFLCIKNRHDLQPLYLKTICKLSGLSAKRIQASSIPIMRSIPGTYSLEQKSIPKRRLVVGAQHARQILLDVGRPLPDKWPDTYLLRFTMATFLPWYDSKSGELHRGLACLGCRHAVDDNIFIDGYHERRDRAYTRQEFLSHISTCQDAYELLADP